MTIDGLCVLTHSLRAALGEVHSPVPPIHAPSSRGFCLLWFDLVMAAPDKLAELYEHYNKLDSAKDDISQVKSTDHCLVLL